MDVVISNSSSNACEPYEERFPDILDNLVSQVIFGIFYTCVWLMGVCGNTVVLYVAIAKALNFSLRTVFIVSLACSDLVLAIFSLPVTSITLFTHNWIFPDFFCKIISFMQACGCFQSSFTLTAMAIDRYCLIFYPHKNIITFNRAQLSTVFMCCLGVLLACPMAMFTMVGPLGSTCGLFCQEDWGDEHEWWRRLYGLAVISLQFGLPLFTSSYCYWRISRNLGSRVAQRLRNEVILPDAMRRLDERKSRTNRMMVVMVLSFFFTWFSLNLLNILADFELAQWLTIWSGYNTMYAFTHLAAMTSSIWNPVIYAWFNEAFREQIRDALCGTIPKNKRGRFMRSSVVDATGGTATTKINKTVLVLKRCKRTGTESPSNGQCLLYENIKHTSICQVCKRGRNLDHNQCEIADNVTVIL